MSAAIGWTRVMAVVLGIAVMAAAPRAGTIYVSGDQPNLSRADDAAVDGGTILLGDGYYAGSVNTGIDLLGKAITIRSMNGPANCVIDCLGLDVAFIMTSGEGRRTILQGLTITRGKSTEEFASSGQALVCVDSSPLVRDCVFIECGFQYIGPWFGPRGGAVSASGGAPRFEDCRFESNQASSGGAVYAVGSAIELVRCTFRDNRAWEQITCDDLCSTTSYYGTGGAVVLAGCAGAVVVDSLFDGNLSYEFGGAITVSASSSHATQTTIASCTFVGNDTFDLGQYQPGEVIKVTNISEPLWVLLSHCIMWDNPSEQSPIMMEPGVQVFVDHSNIQGGWPGEGVTAVDPQFVDAAAHDFRLQPWSPCVDAGAADYVAPGGQADLDGRSRLLDGDLDGSLRIDLGAYETGHLSSELTGGSAPGSSATLTLDGPSALTWFVLVGLPTSFPTPLVPKLGYPLVELPFGFQPLFGPGQLPAAVPFSIPPDMPVGLTVALLPVAVSSPFEVGNFGAPEWLTVF